MKTHCNSYNASMRAEYLLYFNNSRRIGTSKLHLGPVALATVCSEAVVLLLLNFCLLLLPL